MRFVPLRPVLVIVLLAAACGGASIPEPPAQLESSMAQVQTAVLAGDGYAVEAYAFEVSDALLTFRDTPGVPLPMRADLDQLSWEVAAFGANAATGWLEPKEWVSLSSKITRVTQGESPTEGPRYQSEFPPEVIVKTGNAGSRARS